MSNPLHDLLNPPSYTLNQDRYEDLCAIRDKLLLMAQLAGVPSSVGDIDAVLLLRRTIIGQLFAELSFQMSDVLEAVGQTATRKGDAQAN